MKRLIPTVVSASLVAEAWRAGVDWLTLAPHTLTEQPAEPRPVGQLVFIAPSTNSLTTAQGYIVRDVSFIRKL